MLQYKTDRLTSDSSQMQIRSDPTIVSTIVSQPFRHRQKVFTIFRHLTHGTFDEPSVTRHWLLGVDLSHWITEENSENYFATSAGTRAEHRNRNKEVWWTSDKVVLPSVGADCVERGHICVCYAQQKDRQIIWVYSSCIFAYFLKLKTPQTDFLPFSWLYHLLCTRNPCLWRT